MKRYKTIAIALYAIIIIFGSVLIITYSQRKNDTEMQTKHDQVSLLTAKVEELYSKVDKNAQKASQRFDIIYKRVCDAEDNVKLQNEFLQIEFDKWNSYYLKHWKG